MKTKPGKQNKNDKHPHPRLICKTASTRSADDKRPQLSKMSIFDVIVIHIGIPLGVYPVKDSAETCLIFSKYSFK